MWWRFSDVRRCQSASGGPACGACTRSSRAGRRRGGAASGTTASTRVSRAALTSEDHDAEADPPLPLEAQRQGRVDPQEEERDEREIQEEPVEVLEDEREGRLHPVAAVDRGLADGTARRIGEVEAVVGLAVVVAGGPEAERDPQDEQARAEPGRQPRRARSAARRAARGSRRPRTGLSRTAASQQDPADEEVRGADREERPLDRGRQPPRGRVGCVAPKPRGAVPGGLRREAPIRGRACVGSVVIELRVLRSGVAGRASRLGRTPRRAWRPGAR